MPTTSILRLIVSIAIGVIVFIVLATYMTMPNKEFVAALVGLVIGIIVYCMPWDTTR